MRQPSVGDGHIGHRIIHYGERTCCFTDNALTVWRNESHADFTVRERIDFPDDIFTLIDPFQSTRYRIGEFIKTDVFENQQEDPG